MTITVLVIVSITQGTEVPCGATAEGCLAVPEPKGVVEPSKRGGPTDAADAESSDPGPQGPK